jgi:hypothetical protein
VDQLLSDASSDGHPTQGKGLQAMVDIPFEFQRCTDCGSTQLEHTFRETKLVEARCLDCGAAWGIGPKPDGPDDGAPAVSLPSELAA